MTLERAVRVVCASCRTPLLLVGCDRPGSDLWFEVLDKRIRGSAILFQRDEVDPQQVHKILLTCQQKRCKGTPQVTTATLRRALEAVADTPSDLPL